MSELSMTHLDELIMEASEQLIDSALDLSEKQRIMTEIINEVTEHCARDSVAMYKSRAEVLVEWYNKQDDEFSNRNRSRWKPAFKRLELIWQVCSELGQAHEKDYHSNHLGQSDKQMIALGIIFSKGLLVAREIICLMKGGYPDGAMGRWRVLHELAVSAAYIEKTGEGAAEEYIASAAFAARRAARQFNEYAERMGDTPYTSEEMEYFDEDCKEAEKLLGRAISDDKFGEWPKITRKNDMSQLELAVGMQHWRPWYKKASAHNHASYEPIGSLLGLVESEVKLKLIGPSNAGMVAPFQGTAIKLTQIVTSFLNVVRNADRLAHIQSLNMLASEMLDIAIRAEQESLAEARK